jgi:hypothetical protein
VEDIVRNSRRSPKQKAPSGEEKKNQLDLFRDWAVELAKRTAAAAAAAKEATAKHLEELRAHFDQRSVKVCGILVTALGACAYKEIHSPATLVLALAVALSVLLTAVPLVARKTSHFAGQTLRASNHLSTLVFIVGVTSFVVAMTVEWWPIGSPRTEAPREVMTPKAAPSPMTAISDEKALTDEAQKQLAAQEEKEAAQVADCRDKETSAHAARRQYRRRERDFAKCKEDHKTAFTLKSSEAYCIEQRALLDSAARKLDGTMANLCSTTGSTKKK